MGIAGGVREEGGGGREKKGLLYFFTDFQKGRGNLAYRRGNLTGKHGNITNRIGIWNGNERATFQKGECNNSWGSIRYGREKVR